MGVPKKKTSKSRRDKRRTHKKISVPLLSACPQCGKPRLAHVVCPYCGYYRGREVIASKERPKGKG
jgi:large subunit ribosomal protein L32